MTPIFEIKVDGTDYTAMISDRLVELRVVDNKGRRSDRLEILLDDRETIPRPTHGAEIWVWLGYADIGLQLKGVFQHDETDFEWPVRRMRITGSAVKRLGSFRAPRTRSFDDVTLGDLVAGIAAEHGYPKRFVDSELAAITIPHIDQTAESDLLLLSRLAEQYNATFKASGESLLFIPTGGNKIDDLKKLFGTVTLTPGDISTLNVNRQDKTHFNSVKASWYDFDAALLKYATAGDNPPVKELKTSYPNAEEAYAAAQSELDRITRSKATLSITMPGNPKIISECKLVLEGFRDGVDGSYTPERVSHILTKRGGYKCKVEAELRG
jgi:hypothetical protein